MGCAFKRNHEVLVAVNLELCRLRWKDLGSLSPIVKVITESTGPGVGWNYHEWPPQGRRVGEAHLKRYKRVARAA